jgi:hypothetical protein
MKTPKRRSIEKKKKERKCIEKREKVEKKKSSKSLFK